MIPGRGALTWIKERFPGGSVAIVLEHPPGCLIDRAAGVSLKLTTGALAADGFVQTMDKGTTFRALLGALTLAIAGQVAGVAAQPRNDGGSGSRARQLTLSNNSLIAKPDRPEISPVTLPVTQCP